MIDDSKLYRILRPIITVVFKILYRPKFIGTKNIPAKGRIILAGNHTSILDPLLLISTTKRSIHFLAKKELWRFPQNILFSHLGLIPVDRTRKSHNSLNAAYKYLNNDSLVLVFPEGTTEKGRGLQAFKYGAVKMASTTNSLITPFIITGQYRLFRKCITIEFLKPISVSCSLEEENHKLRNIIKEKLED